MDLLNTIFPRENKHKEIVMEIVLAIFLGAWISAAGIVAYFWLRREFRDYIQNKKGGHEQ